MNTAAPVRNPGRCSQRPMRAPDQVKGIIMGSVPRPKAAMVSAPSRALACSHAAVSKVMLKPQGSQPHNMPSAMRRQARSAGSRRFCSGCR